MSATHDIARSYTTRVDPKVEFGSVSSVRVFGRENGGSTEEYIRHNI